MGLFSCRTCGIAKPRTAEFWHSEKTAADGFRRDCKACRNAYRGRVHEQQSADPTFREKKCQVSKIWYKENRGRAAQRGKEYNARDDVKARKYGRLEERRASDPDFAAWEIEYRRKHYRGNRERYVEWAETWRAANPDKAAAINAARNANRRARKQQAEGRYTAGDVRAKLEAQNAKCFWCEADVSGGVHTIDHYIPLARGGTNWPDNLVIACVSCNCTKRDMLPDEFRRYRNETA